MATSPADKPRKRKDGLPQGVRGPGGPAGTPTGRSDAARGPARAPGGSRGRLEELSYPLLRRLHAWPRWIIVIAPAVLLFLGLILTGPLAWLGGIALLLVWVFVAWLTALSWPALTPGSRLFRLIVVLALAGVVVLKFLGRF